MENVLRVVDSKTEEGVRSIALSPGIAEELWQWRRETKFQGDDERHVQKPAPEANTTGALQAGFYPKFLPFQPHRTPVGLESRHGREANRHGDDRAA